jgi:hypothetical protein
VSLLLASGHSEAWSYPIWLVAFEADFLVDRENSRLASQVLLTKMAFDAIPNMGVKGSATRKAAQAFTKAIKGLLGE